MNLFICLDGLSIYQFATIFLNRSEKTTSKFLNLTILILKKKFCLAYNLFVAIIEGLGKDREKSSVAGNYKNIKTQNKFSTVVFEVSSFVGNPAHKC